MIEVFDDIVPKTALNFIGLCTGQYGGNLTYKNKVLQVSDTKIEGASIVTGNGTGAQSIYGSKFEDEGVWLKHSERGLLSMASKGPN